jgi:hypothetical protein
MEPSIPLHTPHNAFSHYQATQTPNSNYPQKKRNPNLKKKKKKFQETLIVRESK